ncbi:MAG TPA: MFS transporter [Thermomicrobiales bacterium]|nr:MFS transporter [Thermomicrobiales bacterium]
MLRVRARVSGALSDSSVLVTTSVVHLTNDACFALLYPLLPFIAEDLNLSYTQTGLLKATFSGASSVLQVPAGIAGGRYGEMLILLLGNLWVGLGLVGMALTGTFVLLLAVAFLTGIGGNAQHPLAASIVSNHVRREQLATSMGTLNFAGDLGKLIGPFVAGILAVQFGWRAAFAGVGIMTACYSLWVLLRQRAESRRGTRPVSRSVADDGTPIRRGFRFVLLAGGLDNATRGAALTFLPFVLVDKGFDAAAISVLYGMIFAAGAAGKFACGWLSDRRGILAVIVATESATAATLLALTWASRWAVIPLVLIFGFALNGTSSALNVAVAQFVPAAKRARGFGIYFTAALISSAGAPLLYGVLADATSITTTFVAMALLTLAVLPAIGPIRGALVMGDGA